MSKNNKTFPAGKYYIGDPCYLFDQSWDKILQENQYFDKEDQVINGVSVMVDGTAWGDGLFFGNFEGRIPVDAGLIGILPVELIGLDNKVTIEQVTAEDFGLIVDFATPIDCYTEEGVFHFGDITIDTNGDDDEEDLWDEDDEDDYWDCDEEFDTMDDDDDQE